MMFGNFQRICGAVIQIGIWQKLKFNLNKKPTPEDLKVWKKFTSSKETIENKDRYLDQKKTLIFEEKKVETIQLINKLLNRYINQNNICC